MDRNQNVTTPTDLGSVTPIQAYPPAYMMPRLGSQPPFMPPAPVSGAVDTTPIHQSIPMGMIHPSLMPTNAWLPPSSQGFSYPTGHFQAPMMMQPDGAYPFNPLMSSATLPPLMRRDKDGKPPLWLPTMLSHSIAPSDLQGPHNLQRNWSSWLQLSESAMSGNDMAGTSYAAQMIYTNDDNLTSVEDIMEFLHTVQMPSTWLDGNPIGHNNNKSELFPIDGVCLFVKDVTPEWEDERNRYGGHLELKLQIRGGVSYDILKFCIDHLWFATALAVTTAASTVDPLSLVTGIRLIKKSPKKKDMSASPFLRLEVWLTSNQDDHRADFIKDLNNYIQKSFLHGKHSNLNHIPQFEESEWRCHSDATKGGSSKRYARQDSRTMMSSRNKVINAAPPKPSNR